MQSHVDGRIVCPGCGPVKAPATEFACELDTAGQQGLCELRCPVCAATLLVAAHPAAVEALHRNGAGHMAIAPFELLERHSGPPLTWDDLLDFTLDLESPTFRLP